MSEFLEGTDLPVEDEECLDPSFKIEDVDYDTVTSFEMAYKYFNAKWSEAQKQLDYILKKESPIDEPPEIIADRRILVRRASKMYLQYIDVTNTIIKCYEHIGHPQKRKFLRKLADACIGRVLELKHNLAVLECSEFQFLDHVLLSLRMSPNDMNIKIPEYFKERGEEEDRRKQLVQHHLDIRSEKAKRKDYHIVTERTKFARSAMVYIRLLQSHERTRQAREVFQELQKRFIVKELNKRREARKGMQTNQPRQSAAVVIQRAFRSFMLRKSVRNEYKAEMNFLRMLPRPRTNVMNDLEREKLDVIKRNKDEYEKSRDALKLEMRTYKVPEMMENLEDKIRSYFRNYLSLYGKYPVFPAEKEGGSTKMFEIPVDIDAEKRETTDTVTETQSQSSKNTKTSKDTKASKDSKTSKDAKNKNGKDKGSEPEGYSLKPSKYLEDLFTLQEEYKCVWFGKQPINFDRFSSDMLKEEVTKEVELEIRLVVDEKMRLELERMKTALKKDSKKKSKKGKGKGKKKAKGKKKKSKKEIDLTPDRTLESLVEELVSQGIIVSYPKYNLRDFIGDYNYSTAAQASPQNEPVACLGDVRRVVNEYCILPMGSQDIHSKGAFVKSLLIAGPKGVGKKSLIYAVCNEIDATMMDLSAENIEGKYPEAEGKQMLLHLVLKVGRLLQPTVIFIRDAENYFYKKKKPAACTLSEPGRLKKDLPKLVKGIRKDDRLMICGTAVLPFDVDLKGLRRSYNKVICISKPDYNCRRSLWREFIVRNKGIWNKKLDMTVLCNLSDGFSAAAIESSVKQTLTHQRLAYQERIPISAVDFVTELANHVPIYEEENRAYKLWLEKMPLGRKRLALLQSEIDETEQEDESEEED